MKLIIFAGIQASGKSTFYRTPIYQEGFDMLFYVPANDDGTFNESCVLRKIDA